MRVLVTGATGFLGGAVSRALAASGLEVVCTGRNRQLGGELERMGLPFVAADLCNRGAVLSLCARVDQVIHCAALSSPWGRRTAFVRANVVATESIVRACRQQGVQRLVHISTPSLYMGAGHRLNVREQDALPPPINHYAATKGEAERIVQEAGLAAIILRPRALFGPGDTTLFPRLIRAVQGGTLPVFGDGENWVDLTYIDNAVHAVQRALEAPDAALGQIYNITDGQPVKLWGVVRDVCAELDLPPPRGRIPISVGRSAAAVLELFHRAFLPEREPRFTRYTAEVLATTMTLDIQRARRLLGYDPPVSTDEGLRRFVAWWRQSSCRG